MNTGIINEPHQFKGDRWHIKITESCTGEISARLIESTEWREENSRHDTLEFDLRKVAEVIIHLGSLCDRFHRKH